MKVRSLILSLAAVMGLALASCNNGAEGDGNLSLSRSSAVVEAGQTVTINATSGDVDVTSQATWATDNEAVATVAEGVVTGVAKGNATITCEYNGQTQTCTIQVIAGSQTGSLLNGSDYYIFQMDETTFGELGTKVTSDLRPNGAYNDDGTLPEGVTRVIEVWNPGAEIADAPQTGVNSFGKAEGWYSVASTSTKPTEGWGNICGGLNIIPATDTELSKLKNLTPDHVFVIVLKGKYTPATSLKIAMTPPAGGDNNNVTLFEVTDSTGEYNDGDWEVFTITYKELVALGLDLSQSITAKAWYPWSFTANGSGNRVDVDAVFFYVPAE